RAVLQAQPDDRKARGLLADVLLWNKKHAEARKLLQALQEADPNDPALPVRFAQLALWSGDYDDALDRFQALLAAGPDDAAYWKSFVDAAASATKYNGKHLPTVLHIYEATRKAPPKDRA